MPYSKKTSFLENTIVVNLSKLKKGQPIQRGHKSREINGAGPGFGFGGNTPLRLETTDEETQIIFSAQL